MKNSGTVTKYTKDRKVVGTMQHSFMKGLSLGWSGLTNLIAMTVAVGVVYLGFMYSYHIVIPKLMDMDQISGH